MTEMIDTKTGIAGRDIVTRLRHMHMEMPFDDYDDLISEAVAEIERLRFLGDRLAWDYEAQLQPLPDRQFQILKAWEEARRG